MIARRSPLLVVAVLCGALVAGCGSSSSTTSSSTTTPIATTKSAPSTPAPAATTSTPATATSTSASGAAGVAEYAALCRSIVEHEPTLPASVKSKVEGICAKAAKGDLAGARAASKEVCAEVIEASPLPAAAKQKALASCKQS